jgi:hypothetical protein
LDEDSSISHLPYTRVFADNAGAPSVNKFTVFYNPLTIFCIKLINMLHYIISKVQSLGYADLAR